MLLLFRRDLYVCVCVFALCDVIQSVQNGGGSAARRVSHGGHADRTRAAPEADGARALLRASKDHRRRHQERHEGRLRRVCVG